MWGGYDIFLKLQIKDSTEMYQSDAVVPSSHLFQDLKRSILKGLHYNIAIVCFLPTAGNSAPLSS